MCEKKNTIKEFFFIDIVIKLFALKLSFLYKKNNKGVFFIDIVIRLFSLQFSFLYKKNKGVSLY